MLSTLYHGSLSSAAALLSSSSCCALTITQGGFPPHAFFDLVLESLPKIFVRTAIDQAMISDLLCQANGRAS